jgi:hypothetical protein
MAEELDTTRDGVAGTTQSRTWLTGNTPPQRARTRRSW